MNRRAGEDVKQFSALFKSTPLPLHCVIHSLIHHNVEILDYFPFEQLISTAGFYALTEVFYLLVSFVCGDQINKSALLQSSQHLRTQDH